MSTLVSVLAMIRVWWVWPRLAASSGLGRRLYRPARRRRRRVVEDIGGVEVFHARRALYLDVPRLTHWTAGPSGWSARVWLRPGDIPLDYQKRVEPLRQGFRAGSVALIPLSPGFARLTVLRRDPLASPPPWGPAADVDGRHLRVAVTEGGAPWIWDLVATPHALIVGWTGGGKSGWEAAIVAALAPTDAAILAADLKHGLELGLAGPRLTTLATTPAAALSVFDAVLDVIARRAAVCRAAGVRNVLDLPAGHPCRRPIVVVVDEVAELLLLVGDGKDVPKRLNVALLRVVQLGRALGVHVVIGGQRFGSDIAPNVTSIRAQLGQRVVCRVADRESAVMGLGDIADDAVVAAQGISEDLPGVAVVSGGPAGWQRVRSLYVSAADLARIAQETAGNAPSWSELTRDLPAPLPLDDIAPPEPEGKP